MLAHADDTTGTWRRGRVKGCALGTTIINNNIIHSGWSVNAKHSGQGVSRIRTSVVSIPPQTLPFCRVEQ
jgi:hypothetical protein